LDPDSEAYDQINRLDKSLEPYRSMFGLQPINLVTYDLFKNKLVDLKSRYYQTYCQISSPVAKRSMVENYLVGVEWLWQYYIADSNLEYSGWSYESTHPPLISDIMLWLRKNPNCQSKLANKLNSYPINDLTPIENYLLVTPNDYTNAGLTPNVADVIDLIDGAGVLYLNKCQIKWHCLVKS